MILNKNRVMYENYRVKQEFGPFPNTALSKNRVKQNRINRELSVVVVWVPEIQFLGTFD